MTREVRGALVALAAVLAVALGGCAAPGGGAGTRPDVGRCAAVLPLASGVVRGDGTLAVVRPITPDDVTTLTKEAGVAPAPEPTRPARPPSPPPPDEQPVPKVCLIVYRGSYPQGSIPQAAAPATTGNYVLVMARVRHPSLIRVLVTRDLPADVQPRPWWKIF